MLFDRHFSRVTKLLPWLTMAAFLFAAPMWAEQPTQLSFEPGKLYEVALFKISPGKEMEIQQRYFSKAFPLAQSYGMRPVGTFSVTQIEHGPDDVATWGFFEWPSLEVKKRFERDAEFRKLRPIRDSLVETLRLVYLEVQEPFTVDMKSDRMYEFYGGWVNRTRAAHLQEYFAVAGPWVGERGVRFLGEFSILGSPDGYRFLPDTVGFIEWPSKKVKEAWFASDEFKQVGFHRALAIDRLVVIESRFDFPEGP